MDLKVEPNGCMVLSTKRTTITIPETLYAEAERLMAAQHFTVFSGFIQHLIRAEHERRTARDLQLAEAADCAPVQPAAKRVSYLSRKPSKHATPTTQ
mgnify:CR=1 FL=1